MVYRNLGRNDVSGSSICLKLTEEENKRIDEISKPGDAILHFMMQTSAFTNIAGIKKYFWGAYE